MLTALQIIESDYRELYPESLINVSVYLKAMLDSEDYKHLDQQTAKNKFDKLKTEYNEQLNQLKQQIELMRPIIDSLRAVNHADPRIVIWDRLNYNLTEYGNKYNCCPECQFNTVTENYQSVLRDYIIAAVILTGLYLM